MFGEIWITMCAGGTWQFASSSSTDTLTLLFLWISSGSSTDHLSFSTLIVSLSLAYLFREVVSLEILIYLCCLIGHSLGIK